MLEKSILNELQLIKGFLALILKTLEGKDTPNHSQILEEQNGHSLGTSSDSDTHHAKRVRNSLNQLAKEEFADKSRPAKSEDKGR